MKSGVIIAGGRSTRFGGGDKAVADLAGTPMIRRVADRITHVVDELVINCRPEQTEAIRKAMTGYPHRVRYVEDDTPDRGPVAGIRNGLGAVEGTYGFVVACDMPFVEPELASYLFDRGETHDGIVPRLDSGWFQPTQAVYRAEAMERACTTALTEENPRIMDALEKIEYLVVEEAELPPDVPTETFENINTRAEFEDAQMQFS